MEPKEQPGEINDSPIEKVRLTVPVTDDTTLQALTFRTWVLGLTACICLAFSNQFFNYRQNHTRISITVFQIFVFPLGKLMAATLPKTPINIPGTKWTFSINPGPFNVKEHVLISMLCASGGAQTAYNIVGSVFQGKNQNSNHNHNHHEQNRYEHVIQQLKVLQAENEKMQQQLNKLDMASNDSSSSSTLVSEQNPTEVIREFMTKGLLDNDRVVPSTKRSKI